MNLSALVHMVFLFWIVLDPFGNIPIFISLLKHFDPEKQKKIIIRELLIALGIMIVFLFFGQGFFQLLNITEASLQMAGGIILFMIALNMIFSSHKNRKTERIPKDPLIVPLAVPAVAGPGILATITLYGGGLQNNLLVLIAIVFSWLLLLPVLLFAPKFKQFLGENGMITAERLFGYIVILISTQMALNGLLLCLESCAISS